MAANFKVWATGDVPVAAEVNDYWQEQVLIRGTAAEIAALGSPAEGWHGVHTDTDRIVLYDGSAWRRIGHYSATGRTGCTLRRAAAQTISTSTTTPVSWDTEDADSDGFIAVTGSTITIPGALGGLYAVSFTVLAAADPRPMWLSLEFSTGSRAFTMIDGSTSKATYDLGVSWVGPLAAGDTFTADVRQSSGGNVNVTGRLNCYRLGL
jgi:hypothetical protein